jgi:peptidoglycan/LPS O-acetylase OafA/YrhL
MTERRTVALDGLRAIAVLAVIVEHTLPLSLTPMLWWGPGGAGVRLFFVLSGYLISGILLDARRDANAQRYPLVSVLYAFYVRRALRIFPLAYLALALAAVAGLPAMREHGWWYLTYTSNWMSLQRGFNWDQGLGHFWSLAVEEQFYLLWPTLLLFTPQRRRVPAIIGCLALAALVRVFLMQQGLPLAANTNTFARMDALAFGALLAVWQRHGRLPIRPIVFGGLIGACATVWLSPASAIGLMVHEWTGILISAALILAAVSEGRIARALSLRPLVYLGTISYGIYVIHLLVPAAVHVVEQRLDIWARFPYELGWPQFLIVTATTVVLAGCSWHYIERPINNQKRRWPYVPRRREVAAAERHLATAL